MEVEAWIKKKKELYTAVLNFLETEGDSEEAYQNMTQIIENQEILKNREAILEIFQLLYKIGDNHHRTADLFNRIGLIFEYLTKNCLSINATEIIDIYKANKRLLLLLFEHKVIIPSKSIFEYLMKINDFEKKKLNYYLYSEIKDFLGRDIEDIIKQEFNESIESFESKIKEGENDSYICKLIRKDSIQEFIAYVNRTNLSLSSTIEPDFYESNSLLIESTPSLIEYASFYGSFQVINYLKNNHVEITPKIWIYAVHSNNPEMIKFLIKNKIPLEEEKKKVPFDDWPDSEDYSSSSSEDEVSNKCKVIMESIKCHHNDIAEYIKNGFTDGFDNISQSIVDSCNYYFYPYDIIGMISEPRLQFHLL